MALTVRKPRPGLVDSHVELHERVRALEAVLRSGPGISTDAESISVAFGSTATFNLSYNFTAGHSGAVLAYGSAYCNATGSSGAFPTLQLLLDASTTYVVQQLNFEQAFAGLIQQTFSGTAFLFGLTPGSSHTLTLQAYQQYATAGTYTWSAPAIGAWVL